MDAETVKQLFGPRRWRYKLWLYRCLTSKPLTARAVYLKYHGLKVGDDEEGYNEYSRRRDYNYSLLLSQVRNYLDVWGTTSHVDTGKVTVKSPTGNVHEVKTYWRTDGFVS